MYHVNDMLQKHHGNNKSVINQTCMSKIKSAKEKSVNKNISDIQSSEKGKMWNLCRWMPWIGGGIFCLIALYQLIGMNSDYLYAVQEHSLFIEGKEFFIEMMSKQGGLTDWIGCYLTQFFYVPAIGATILVGLWILTYLIMMRAFPIPKVWTPLLLIPLFALLSSVTGLGYWLYFLKIDGYWFAESVSVLLVVSGYWGYRHAISKAAQSKRTLFSLGYIALWTIIGYPLMGWYALFGALMMALSECVGRYKQKWSEWLPVIIGTGIIIGIAPLCWYYGFTRTRLADAWICGFPLFEVGDYSSWIMVLPFVIVAVSLLFLAIYSTICNQHKDCSGKEFKQSILSLVVLGISVWGAWQANVTDYNYHAELRMYKHTEESNWKEVVKEVRNWKETPTRQMVLLKNIALMNTGNLGTQMFRCDNGGKYPYRRDSLVIHLTQTCAPMIYYQYGKFNYATRWSIENGVEYGFNVGSLKLLARCALLNGEYNVAEKYISQLKKTTFHKSEGEWLNRFLVNPALLNDEPSFRIPTELNHHMGNILDTDNGFCEMYILHNFSKTMNIDSKILQEVTLSYALVSKDIQLFWPRFFQYATLHKNKQMPIHYQEAAFLYGNLEKKVDISKMPFDKEKIVNRYAKFNQTVQGYMKRGMSTEQIGAMCKPSYGDTFWWFYFFCNDVDSY